METVTRYVLNTFVSASITFYFAFLFVFLMRPFLRNYRALYYLYLLPFFKVLYDIVCANHSHWAFLKGKAVVGAMPNSRILSAYVGTKGKMFAGLRFHFQEGGETFSLGDIAAETLGVPLTFGIALLLLSLTAFAIILWTYKLIRAYQWKRNLPICHHSEMLYTTTATLHTPILIRNRVVIPKPLLQRLSSNELQAIICHENEHRKWRDPILSLISSFLSSLFWFIPFQKTFLKQGELYRELACDVKADKEALIGALGKTMQAKAPLSTLAFSSYSRVLHLLNRKPSGKIALIVSLLILLGGGAFIFASHFLPF